MFVLIYTAILPVVIFLIWIYTRDKINPEPKRLVLRLFVMGMIVPLPAAFIERQLLISKASHDQIFGVLFSAFFVAGVVEEFLKALFFQETIYRHREFDEPIDGVVYAATLSLGFAMVENIMYVTGNGLAVAFLRSVTAIPGHMFFGVIMGYYFARAKQGLNPRYYAYVIPAFYHGVYDSFAMIDGFLGYVSLLLFLGFLTFLSTRYIRQLKVIY